MLFDVGNIITLVITVLLIVVFRQLDRNNRSLEKVKKYSDKIKAELDEYFKNRAQSLQDASVELDVKQTQAIASVKRLDQMKETFAQSADSLQKQTEQMSQIEEKIASYDDTLKNLTLMTSQAEENLRRLTSESEFADRLNKKLREAKDQLAHIEADIPGLRSAFDADNAKRLADVESSVVDRLSARITEIDNSITRTGQESVARAAEVKSVLEKSFAEAARKADTLEDTAFEKLHAKALERLQKYQASYEEKNGRLQELVKEKLAEVQTLAKTFKSEWHEESSEYLEAVRAEIQELRAAHADSAARLEAAYRETEQTVQGRSEELAGGLHRLESELTGKTSELGSMIETLETTYAASSQRLENDVSRLDVELRAQLERDFGSLSASCTETLKRLEAEVSGKTASLREELDSGIMELRSSAERASSSLEETFRADTAGMNERLNAVFERLNGDLKNKTDTIETGAEDTFNRLSALLSEKSSALLAEITSRIESVSAEHAERVDNLSSDLAARAGGFEAGLKKETENAARELEETFARLRAEIDGNRAGIFGEFQTRFDEYEKDVLYRFDRLDKVTMDTDMLEAQLRRAMDETQGRVLGDFDLFTRGQQDRQSAFEREQQDKEDALAERMRNLESSLNELKSKAYSNVSEKLKVFEDDFFVDLNKRNESINAALNEWKASLDEKLATLSTSCEDDRREQEQYYAEELRKELSAVNEKYREQTSRLEQQIAVTEEALRSRISASDDALKAFTDEYRAEFAEARKASEDYLKNELSAYSASVQEQLRRAEREISAQTRELADNTETARNESAVALDSIRGEFAQWKTRIDQQFAEAKDTLAQKLGALEEASSGAIEHASSAFASEVEQFGSRAAEEHGRIEGLLGSLQNDIRAASDSFDARSAGALDEFRKSYDTMMEETQRRIREQNADADQRLRALKTFAQDAAEKNADMQDRIVQKIQNDANALNVTLDEIDGRLKSFMSQTRLFDRADEMKEQLESQLADLRGDISRVEGFRQMLSDVEQQFTKIKRLEEELSQKMIRFTSEKKRLEILESDFNRLMSLADSMDRKIHELNTTNDDLQVLEVEVRRFQESLAEIGARYERLEKKNEVLDQTITGVDKAFSSLKTVEKELQNCAEQVSVFPDQIIDLKRGVEKLLDNGDRINLAVDKLTSLDAILQETEKRTENMQKAREWLARTETRLEEISKQAQEQVKLMGDLLKDDGGVKKDRGAPSISVRETVTKLAHQGWKIDEIARATKLSRGEVELILELSQGN